MSNPRPIRRRPPFDWHHYTPRTVHPMVLTALEIIANANKGDTFIISVRTLMTFAATRLGFARCERFWWYHLKEARRQQLITRQSRWRRTRAGDIERARSITRIAWRRFQQLGRAARTWAMLAPKVVAPGRRETVQKIAAGVQELLSSVVPRAPPLRSGA